MAGWSTAALGDVCRVIRGITFPASSKELTATSSNVACLRTTNIQREVEWADVYFVPQEYVKREEQFVRAGDVLMSMANSYELVGKVAIVRVVPRRAAFGAFLAAIRPTEAVDVRFLFHWLRTHDIQRKLREGSSQTTNIANISASRLAKLEIPLPPLAEQKCIADKLDRLLASVDTCKARLDAIPAILKRFRQSVLAAATSGKLTEEWRSQRVQTSSVAENAIQPCWDTPTSWKWLAAKDVVEEGAEIVYGIVQPGPKLSVGVPYVRGKDIENGRILVEQLLKTSPEIAGRYSRASIRGGDVLLGIIRATKVALVPDALNGANITQGTARFRPSKHIRSRFLAAALESPRTQAWLHEHYRGIDMPGLNLADVRQLPLPMPPLDEQDEILRRLHSLQELAEQLEFNVLAADVRVRKLTQSLLAKAFRGELVPHEPIGASTRVPSAHVSSAGGGRRRGRTALTA